jgi:two-component system chemotaxis response regulator CheB
MFAKRLDEQSPIEVKEAQSGDVLIAGRALICPGNRHIRIHRMAEADVVVLTDQPPLKGHRPSADILFRSIAREYGREAAAVIMTGMGADGADGMCDVFNAGGLTLAQSPDTCVVDSMPRAAIDRGCVTRVVPLSMLALQLQAHSATARTPAGVPALAT